MTQMASSTRRVLVPIAWPKGIVGRGHLLPDLRAHHRTAFVRVPGGRPVPHGMVAYVGSSVTAADMLARWESSVGPVAKRDVALDDLEAYVRWVSGQKIGSVFEAVYDTNGMLTPRKISDSAPTERIPIPE